MYPIEKCVGIVLSLKNVIYALYDEYKQKLTSQIEVGEMSQVSTSSVVESVRKEKSQYMKTKLFISQCQQA